MIGPLGNIRGAADDVLAHAHDYEDKVPDVDDGAPHRASGLRGFFSRRRMRRHRSSPAARDER